MTTTSIHGLPENTNVSELLEAASKEFSKDPNFLGVRIGERRKGGETKHDELSLVVLVKEKLPKDAVKKQYLIPPELGGVTTDVNAPFGPDMPKEALGLMEGHLHADDMAFAGWERLHEQWLAESEGEVAWHGKVQDFGDICVIEDDGSLVKTVGGTQVVDFVQAYKLFRSIHPDIYDFVSFFTDSENGMPPQGPSSWYRFVYNDTQGIGFSPTWNSRPTYGSNVLQGILFLNQGHFPYWRYVMLQEQAHRRAAFASSSRLLVSH